MAKITLSNILSGFSLQRINDNFQKIQDALNGSVLYRDNPDGEDNTVKVDIDMNGHKIYNLPAPTADSHAARLKDVKNAIDGLAGFTANLIAFEPTPNVPSSNLQGAVEYVGNRVESVNEVVQELVSETDSLRSVTDGLFALKKSYSLAKASSALNGSSYQLADLNKSEVITSADGHTGLLVTASPTAYIDILLPYGVAIGDSISEGHPALHGRLHPTFNAAVGSEPGQLSYELSKHFGLPMINHGIGGQTSVQVRNRWGRDVLAYDQPVGDGIPSLTMGFAGGKMPHVVYLHVGINDIFQDVPVSTMKDNYTYFAQSCRDHDIVLIMANIGPDNAAGFTSQRQANATEINRWLSAEFAQMYPEVHQVDFLGWASNGTRDFLTLRPNCFADDVHPTKAGYELYGDYIAKSVVAPVFCKGLVLNSAISSDLTNFARTIEVRINGKLYSLPATESISTIDLGQVDPDEPTYRLEILDYAVVTGNQRTGFAQIYSVFSTSRNGNVVAKAPNGTRPNNNWPLTFTGLTTTGTVNKTLEYQVFGDTVFFQLHIVPSGGGTSASTANTTYFTLPYLPKARGSVTFVGSNTENLGNGLIETGAGGVCFTPTWASTTSEIHAAGFYTKAT